MRSTVNLIDFRTDILNTVRDCLYELELHSTTADPDRPGFFYPQKYTGAIDNVQAPNHGYNTPVWQVLTRPITPQDVREQGLIPSVFLRIMSGMRSARGQGLQDSPVGAAIGMMTEDYEIYIHGVFQDGRGAAEDVNNVRPGTAKPLSEQITGFVWDLDKCLNVHTARSRVLSGDDDDRSDAKDIGGIVDLYVSDWQVMKAMEGSPTEVVVAKLIVTINFDRNLMV